MVRARTSCVRTLRADGRASRMGARSRAGAKPSPVVPAAILRAMKRLISMKATLLVSSHLLVLAIGFGLGVYALPILIAPTAPTQPEIAAQARAARYTGQFRRDLKDSDPLHWGQGTVSVGPTSVVLEGELAPGPDYKLYLSPSFVETEADFRRLKPQMIRIGDVKTFRNFLVSVPESADIEAFNTVIVWCETFSQFITAAQYK